ncbi:MAG: DUF6171 family protein [Eubacteriales bacterium]|nr:DUF6171 family protein [Eubacteriales bacterium]
MCEKLRICRKCLPGTDRDEYLENLAGYIERMDEEVKVSQPLYEERLSICASCQNLINGMCRLCGCFVELRAAQKVRKCPDIPAKWEKII